MRLAIGFVLLQILRLLMELKCGLVLFRIAALHTLRSFSRLFNVDYLNCLLVQSVIVHFMI